MFMSHEILVSIGHEVVLLCHEAIQFGVECGDLTVDVSSELLVLREEFEALLPFAAVTFPRQRDLREEWALAVCRSPAWAPSHWSVVCSEHFSDGDFASGTKGHGHLMDNSVPSLAGPTKVGQDGAGTRGTREALDVAEGAEIGCEGDGPGAGLCEGLRDTGCSGQAVAHSEDTSVVDIDVPPLRWSQVTQRQRVQHTGEGDRIVHTRSEGGGAAIASREESTHSGLDTAHNGTESLHSGGPEDALELVESEVLVAQACNCLRVVSSSHEDSRVESVEGDRRGAECGFGSGGGKGIGQLFSEGKLANAVCHRDGQDWGARRLGVEECSEDAPAAVLVAGVIEGRAEARPAASAQLPSVPPADSVEPVVNGPVRGGTGAGGTSMSSPASCADIEQLNVGAGRASRNDDARGSTSRALGDVGEVVSGAWKASTKLPKRGPANNSIDARGTATGE
ncbi:hypothetical protein HPB49_004614 [Dermacentor silvarum]|uniref:Uncharacterized protein n=1 Tax=Dermacentor silvarum TaxID=543639 RepID=A0ACB8DAT4_DERSI|nr:hypothetical protein HPB49_004614 [Dermacentor silvarum]